MVKISHCLGFLVAMDTVFSIVDDSSLYGELTPSELVKTYMETYATFMDWNLNIIKMSVVLRARTLEKLAMGLNVTHFIFH